MLCVYKFHFITMKVSSIVTYVHNIWNIMQVFSGATMPHVDNYDLTMMYLFTAVT